jgi:hypothetical protein
VFLVAILISRMPRRQRVASALGVLCSWSIAILFRTAIKNGSAAFSWVPIPTVMGLMRYYLHSPIYVIAHPTVSDVVNVALLALIASGLILALRRYSQSWSDDDGRRLLVIICGLLMLLPVGVFVESHLYKAVWVHRYLMPYGLGVAGSCAGALWLLEEQLPDRYSTWKRVAVVVAIVAILGTHLLTLSEQEVRPRSALEPYLSLGSKLPLVLEDGNLFFQTHYYDSAHASNIVFLLNPIDHGTLAHVKESGYQKDLVYEDDFLAAHPHFLYVDIPWAHSVVLERLSASHPELKVEQIGQLPYMGTLVPLLDIQR